MKKIIAISGLLLFSATIYTTSANALALTPTAAGAPVLITNTTGAAATSPGPTLTFNPSPGVSMSASTRINSYAIAAANASAAGANRNEFGVWSGYGGYYQATSTALGNAAAAVCEDINAYDPSTTNPFTTALLWAAMGGSGT